MKLKITLLLALLFSVTALFSQNPNQTFSAGSYIVNMGDNSSINKGLKPYGFVYALLKNNTPVYWSINSSKTKDGKDFTANGVDYKGGTFIVSAEDAVNSSVSSLISTWKSKGA